MKRRSSTSVKKILHSGHTFSTRDSFPPGVLPTKRHVIERILHLKNFRTFNAANDIAREIYDRWVWCNVYPIHLYTISKKVQSLTSIVRLFEPPTLDLTVNSYYKMVNLTSCHQQPPVIEHLTDLDIEQCRIRPLQLDHPCHNQCVERHVKMVTEATAQVEGFERRDGLIRQKIKSRKLLKKFDTKVQF